VGSATKQSWTIGVPFCAGHGTSALFTALDLDLNVKKECSFRTRLVWGGRKQGVDGWSVVPPPSAASDDFCGVRNGKA
jgi:hypothetical protein